jgi:hypothetical protein
MRRFLDSNEGLSSRFSRRFTFEDYEPDELMAIMRQMVAEKQLTLSEEAALRVEAHLSAMHRFRDASFGNARSVRNLLNEIYERQAVRLTEQFGTTDTLSDQVLQTLEATDVPAFVRPSRAPEPTATASVTIRESSTDQNQQTVLIVTPPMKEQEEQETDLILVLPHQAADRPR